jgi:alkanesulfonate monooxygenase SsuD/methylene tetrahydromethanopterin reductase-like flavin-dependent oxidoreductase (luciferase family)
MTPAMRFGLSGSLGGLEARSRASTLERAREVERLGFAGMWFNEEHFGRPDTPHERRILSPIVLAMAVAAATTRLRVGFSVLLVPLHHPLRLAEEIATLDVLSGGRVDLGVSRANSERYGVAFGYDKHTGPTLEHCLDTMIGHWAGEPLTIGGVDYTVSPVPTQQPHPPIYVGAYSESTIEWAARRGYATIQHGIQSPASLHRCLTSYAAHGGDVSRVPVGRFCYVAESDAQARKDVWDIAVRQTERLHGIGIWRRGDQVMNEADLEPERFYHETAIIGGPDTVAKRIAHLRDTYGIRYVNLLSSFFGLMPNHLLRSSLELFAHEVMPRFTSIADPQPETR